MEKKIVINNYIKNLLLLLIVSCFASVSAQNNDLYLIFDKSGENTEFWEKQVNDTLEIKVFSIYKHIPVEKYTYSLSIKDGKLEKGIVGSTSWNNKGSQSFTYANGDVENFEVSREFLKEKNILKTNELDEIKWSSFKAILDKMERIFILIKNENKKNIYTAYQVKH